MRKFTYDISKYGFQEKICKIFGVKNLANLHKDRNDLLPTHKLVFENESKTEFHKRFYRELKDTQYGIELKEAYFSFLKNEIKPLMKCDFIFQAFPSFRVHLPDDQAIHYWHYDSDADHMHPEWEINFQIAITDMFDTNCTWVESVPGLNDFTPMEMEYGEYTVFDGNRCLHGNKPNTTDHTRVSFDFRVIPLSRYTPEKYKDVCSATKKNKFKVGHYYSKF
jgi:hypothetical protein